MHQQRVRIQADRRRLAVKNRSVGRTRKSKHTETDAHQFQRVYSPMSLCSLNSLSRTNQH
jgi:hypothetical protein